MTEDELVSLFPGSVSAQFVLDHVTGLNKGYEICGHTILMKSNVKVLLRHLPLLPAFFLGMAVSYVKPNKSKYSFFISAQAVCLVFTLNICFRSIYF